MAMNVESGIRQDASDYAAYDEDEAARLRRRRLMIIAAASIAVLIALLAAVMLTHKKPVAVPDSAPTVTVIVPGRSDIAAVLSSNGSLAAKREMPVGIAGEGGMVQSVFVEPGDWVKAGQTLAVIERSVQTQEAGSLAAGVKVARANANIAQADYDRAKALVSRGFISKADLERKAATRDAAAAQVSVAQAQLGEAQARIGRLSIRSPAAGLVLTRAVEPGQVVGPSNGALFRVAKDGELEIKAQLSEQDMAQLHVGSSAKVTPVGSAQSFGGVVWQLSPVIDPTTRQGTARIQLPYNKALRPGGFAAAEIAAGRTTAPQLPESAVLSDAKGNYVYIVNAQNKVERRDVKVGNVSDSGLTIQSGLDGTEKVVFSAGAFLNPGDTVKPTMKTGR